MVDISVFDPSPKVLRYIASYIGVLSPEDTIELLEDCGVPSEQIEASNDSKKIIYHLFKKLASSDKKEDHKLLVKIISESISPALYEQQGLTEEKIVDTYNNWLHREKLQLVESDYSEYRITTYIPTSIEMEKMEQEEVEQENNILKSVLQPYIKDIAEITVAYKLLLQLVEVFSQKSFPVDQHLNDYYLRLFAFVENRINYIHSEIEKLYNTDNPFDAPPSSYIHPDIYNNAYGKSILYKPFTNLYLAEKEMEQDKVSWENIKKQMDTCFGWIDNVNHQFKADKIQSLPHQKLWDEVSDYLKHFIKIDYKDLFGFEGTKFWLKRIAAENLVISFHPKKGGTTDPLCLLHAFIDYIKKYGKYNNGMISAIVPRSDTVDYLKSNYPNIAPPVWEDWIKSTKHNLLQKMTDEDKKFIIIEDYDEKTGYPISIKLPLNNPSTP